MIDFSFISARFLGADANKVFVLPCENNRVDLRVGPTQSDESVVFTVVDSLQDLIGKDLCDGEERNPVFAQIDFGFLFVPLEFQFRASPRPWISYTNVYTYGGNNPAILKLNRPALATGALSLRCDLMAGRYYASLDGT
jgi:hypothetical protein